ncbi:hypothetical protein HAX54_008783 [Datura stramonium]|uniref:Uncharacterized protein n=1 Tax=Datura stramonium TaxID=4076 RepID=A0ABS8WXZ9_DATST|nr:hypothetical protein [Datura stramonium]
MDDQPTEVDDDELLLVVLLARARFNGIHGGCESHCHQTWGNSLGCTTHALCDYFPKFYKFGYSKDCSCPTRFVVQLFAIGTTIYLINNMAPPKRAS